MNRERGAGILELLVGMFVSVLIMLVVMGSVSFYQGVQRTSISGNSALASAVSGLYLMGNDVRLAGLGMTVSNQLACSTFNAYYNGVVKSNNGIMAPIQVVDNASIGADTITVMYGDAIYSGAPTSLLASQTTPASTFNVPMSAGLQTGPLALLTVPASGLPCTLIGVTNVNTAGNNAIISHDTSSLYNPANPATTFSTPVTYSTSAYFVNINSFHWNTWSLVNNILQVTDNMTGTVETIADNVVQMQAEYGVTNGVTTGIAQWVRATGTWATLSATTISQIRAVRIAIVSRSTQPEKSKVAGVCNTTTTAPTSWSGSPALDLSSNSNWRCYRYRVVRMVFPLKNIVWGN